MFESCRAHLRLTPPAATTGGVPARRKELAATPAAAKATGKRRYVSQSDVPLHTLDEALRVPRAIADNYGKQPTRPLDVAAALELQPTSSRFRTLAGAALAYELTDGGPKAEQIGLTDVARRIVAPMEEGDDFAAKREALMKPRVVREFLQKYDGSRLPAEQIGRNVLEGMGVPTEATERTQQLIVSSAASLGLLTEIDGKRYVNLKTQQVEAPEPEPIADADVDEEGSVAYEEAGREEPEPPAPTEVPPPKEALLKNRRVFISHGSNKKIVEQLKELLEYGDFEPVVSVERETTAKPVPEKVLSDMRSCGAGIIHVGTERLIVDQDGKEHRLLNPNVLIEIGAAMALFGSNYILLVEEGATLPSNLQGLYEARYKGDALDHDATMKLLRTLREFKT
jgi:Predicted nucleotide-binding protein containing TIR-like domain